MTLIPALLTTALALAAGAPRDVPLDAAARAGLARSPVHAQAHGKTLDCEGVALADLLRRAGALPEQKLPGAALDHIVIVRARDGYRVAWSLAKLDPHTGARAVWLVDTCDGKALDANDGPLRLIAPDEKRPARWVRQVESIEVIDPE